MRAVLREPSYTVDYTLTLRIYYIIACSAAGEIVLDDVFWAPQNAKVRGGRGGGRQAGSGGRQAGSLTDPPPTPHRICTLIEP